MEIQIGLGYIKHLSANLQILNLKFKLIPAQININDHIVIYAPWIPNIEQVVKVSKNALSKTLGRQNYIFISSLWTAYHMLKSSKLTPLKVLAI